MALAPRSSQAGRRHARSTLGSSVSPVLNNRALLWRTMIIDNPSSQRGAARSMKRRRAALDRPGIARNSPQPVTPGPPAPAGRHAPLTASSGHTTYAGPSIQATAQEHRSGTGYGRAAEP